MTTDTMTSPIGANVKRLREAAGLTQQQLAVDAKLSVSIVSQIEQGRTTDPRAGTLSALARVLKVTVDELLRQPEEKSAADATGHKPPATGVDDKQKRKSRKKG